MKYPVEFKHPLGLSPDEQVFISLLQEKKFDIAQQALEEADLKVDLDFLKAKGVILNTSSNVKELILSKKNPNNVQDIEDWIEDYRLLFKGKKMGAMGSKSACIFKMKKFLVEYPEYADINLIMDAARRYINSEKKNGYMYLQRADYIISKKDHDSVNSRLAIFCEEVNSLEDTTEKFNSAGRQTI